MGLVATYAVHLSLTGKHIVDFILVLIELFYLGVTAEVLREIIGSKSAISLPCGRFNPTFQVDRIPSHLPFFLSEN